MLRDRLYKKSKARSADRAFFWATTGLALSLMQFLQAISTTLGNTFSVGTLVGLFRATFNQTFLFQAITATFGNTFGVGAFVGVFRTVFSNGAFGVITPPNVPRFGAVKKPISIALLTHSPTNSSGITNS